MFSVITVTYNDLQNLERTLKSIQAQQRNLFEWLVIDGNSTDGTQAFLKNNTFQPDRCISEPDNGIYDAMNKGLALARGEYLVFLNAGDTFYDTDTLSIVMQAINNQKNPDFVYGDAIEKNSGNAMNLRPSRSLQHRFIGMFTHHQSMYYSNALIRKHHLIFDTSFSVAADYKFTCEFLNVSTSELYIPKPLSIFGLGGISSVHWQKSIQEQWRIRRDVLHLSLVKRIGLHALQTVWHILKHNFPRLYSTIRYKQMVK